MICARAHTGRSKRLLATRAVVALAAAMLAPPGAGAQPSGAPATERPQVLVLGTPHLANPGLDAVNQKVDDVLTPRRQAELEQIAGLLAAWRPTKIAVEVPPAADSTLQVSYARYRRGELPPGGRPSRGETTQIGMRLAKRLGHARLHPIDVRRDLDVNGVFSYAAAHGQGAIVRRAQQTMGAAMAKSDSVMRHGTLVDVLRAANDPAADSLHALNLQPASVGVPSGVGADATFLPHDVPPTRRAATVRSRRRRRAGCPATTTAR